MPRRRRREPPGRVPIDLLFGRLFKVFWQESEKDLVCYLPPGERTRNSVRIFGPGKQWDSDRDGRRDTELCSRIWKGTGCSVGACFYDVYSSVRDGVARPRMWIRDIYDFARRKKYRRLHLVGYSGGAMLGSSQLVFYPPRPQRKEPIVRTLVLIAGDVAAGRGLGHANAAYFADKIKARTRLIWGTKDFEAKRGVEKWKELDPKADSRSYDGTHNFYSDGQFDKVARMVVDWLTEDPAIKRLAERKVHKVLRARSLR